MIDTKWLSEDERVWLTVWGETKPPGNLLKEVLSRLAAERQKVAELVEALRKLANEASGFRCHADLETHGATNMQVLGQRITEAFDALAKNVGKQ